MFDDLAVLIRDRNEPTGLINVGLELAKRRRDLYEKLVLKRAQYLYPQEKGKTELDRKVMLDASVSEQESDYEFALRLETLLDFKIRYSGDRHDDD